MAKLGKQSQKNLNTCKETLRFFVEKLVEYLNEKNDPALDDIAVTCGLRGETDQNKAVSEGTSKLVWPKGKHNNPLLPIIPEDTSVLTEEQKSNAVDIVPYPSLWEDTQKLDLLGKIGKEVIKKYNLPIEWGGDWRSFPDKPHWQIKD